MLGGRAGAGGREEGRKEGRGAEVQRTTIPGMAAAHASINRPRHAQPRTEDSEGVQGAGQSVPCKGGQHKGGTVHIVIVVPAGGARAGAAGRVGSTGTWT
jgi:hypothetical protein